MMMSFFRSLGPHRRSILLSKALSHESFMGRVWGNSVPFDDVGGNATAGRQHKYFLLFFSQHSLFSTGYSSIHGERPSAEYAKLRKESLETEFGEALGTYSSKNSSSIYLFGPFLAFYRAAVISFFVLKLAVWQIFVTDIKKRAIKFRETLILLGPFYIKLGQALSTRPDILPPIYCKELAQLQDQIPPFPTSTAIRSIETQLGFPISQIFADISPEPIAAASLGQVYKAHLHSGELVAVKVQRPGISLSLTLDAMLFQMIGGQLKRFAKARKDLLVAVNEMVRHMFDEIDYVNEGKNAERFATLYGSSSLGGDNNIHEAASRSASKKRNSTYVKVPKIYWDLTRKSVLTMEWIDGIKLTDEAGLNQACLDRRNLIDQGVYSSLRQLLEIGFFHADPHPGNLVATDDGSLAYFDFGMMGDIPRHYRVGLIRVLVHFVNRDSLGLANDFLSLGFIHEGIDIQAISDALQASFSEGTAISQDFQGIMNQLYDVMYEFNFSLPPDYALVIRALGSLEGTAKVLDPDFKVIESAYPFIIGRLLEDPDSDMRRVLRELLIRNDGSIRWNRLERLITAISEQPSEPDSDPSSRKESSRGGAAMGWKSFDMRAVVAATEDFLLFVLSDKGLRVRVFLLRDIMKAVDAFLQDEVVDLLDEDPETSNRSMSEGRDMLTRVVGGFQSLYHAVSLAPEVWISMFIRVVSKQEYRTFVVNVQSTLLSHSTRKLPETFWLCISKLLHKLNNNNGKP